MALTAAIIDSILCNNTEIVYLEYNTLSTFIAACSGATDIQAKAAAEEMQASYPYLSYLFNYSMPITAELYAALAIHLLTSDSSLATIADFTASSTDLQNVVNPTYHGANVTVNVLNRVLNRALDNRVSFEDDMAAILHAVLIAPAANNNTDIYLKLVKFDKLLPNDLNIIYNSNTLTHTELGELAANPQCTTTQISNIANDIINDLSNGTVKPSALLHYKNSIGKFSEIQQAQLITHVLSLNNYEVASKMSATSRANIGKLILK